MPSRFVLLTAVLGVIFVAPGCNKEDPQRSVNAVVEGVVLLDGSELTSESSVNFVSPSTGGSAIATVGPDGTFKVVGGMVPGEYKVTVTPPSPTPDNPSPKPSKIPEKYRSRETSDLASTITKGNNQLKLELKTP